MELLHSSDKLTFVVDNISSYLFPKTGGSIATHKMVFELANKGHYVYVFVEPQYPHENIRTIPTQIFPKDDGWQYNYNWEPFNYNLDRTIAIYTQITWGNPFGIKHVARWMLHDYDPEIWKTYGENEVFFNYGTFKTPKGTEEKPLTIFDYGIDFYKNYNNEGRKGFAHILHKFTPDWGKDFLSHFGSVEIPNYHGKKNLEYLVEEFNKYDYVMTFDPKTYLTTAAALCGAKGIILNPDLVKSPFQYRCENPIQTYGVAYGLNDLKHADCTIDLVRSNLLELQKQDQLTIDSFINFWLEKTK